MKKCSSEKQAENLEYYAKFYGDDSQKLAENSYCLDMYGLYLAGEPYSKNEASLVISFEPHPDLIIDRNHPDFDSEKFYYYR